MKQQNKLAPTKEQQDIINTFKTTRVLKVNACAGSGKSSTLKMLANDNQQPSLYICFNKSVAEEAREKFPNHVECRTTHSLAYAEHGKHVAHKLKRPVGTYRNVAGTSSEIAKYYRISDYHIGNDEIKATTIASFARTAVERFQCSTEEKFSSKLLPYYEITTLKKNHPGLDIKDFGTVVLKYARKLWMDRTNPASEVICTPDTYLKLWQLSKPVLNYDIIYVDESQDSNPTVLDVVRRQTQSKVCYVGDTHQSIYQFRGAVNAMELIDAPSLTLSKSFRYGQKIADIANWLIGDEMEVKGLESINSIVKDVASDQYTMIFRTNGALFERAVDLIAQGKEVFCEVDTKGFIKKLESADSLYRKNFTGVKHEDITPYSSWSDLKTASEEEPELKRLARIVESKQTTKYVSTLSNLKSKAGASILLTTAHKSKGMEWDNVIVADDFPIKPCMQDNTNTQEINLFYVAVTRAIKTLQLPYEIQEMFEELEDERE